MILVNDDDRVGRIGGTGGTDLAAAPYETPDSRAPSQSCRLIELKFAADLSSFVTQTAVEFIAARCLSNQPHILVALTDLSTKAIVFHSNFDTVDNFTIYAVIRYLLAKCFIMLRFLWRNSNAKETGGALAFETARLTHVSTRAAWVQFPLVVGEVPDWSGCTRFIPLLMYFFFQLS